MSSTKKNELLLVLGGARSGKSSWALRYVEDRYHSYLFLATAQVTDEEMAERIRMHKQSRGAKWHLIEEPISIPEALKAKCGDHEAVLMDCLTIWLSNIMLRMEDQDLFRCQDHLLDVLSKRERAIVIVSNEVGTGIVPEHALGRKFRDHAGMLNQRIAAMADKVVFMIAGLPMYLKGF